MSEKLAEVLAAIRSPAPQGAPLVAAPAPVDNSLSVIVTLMQTQMAAAEARANAEREERRQDDIRRREEKAEANKILMGIAGIILPKLLDKPQMDPLVLKMLENSSNKDAMQQFMAAQSNLNQQSSQMFMQNMAAMFTNMGDMQAKMTDRQMEMMEDRLSRMADREDEDEEGSPIMDIVKAILPAVLAPKAAAVGAAVVDAAGKAIPAAPAAQPTTALTLAPQAQPVQPVRDRVTDNKVKLLQTAMALHLRGDSFDPEKRRRFQTALVTRAAQLGDVAEAIVSDDQAALFAALAPAVSAEPPLGRWLGSQETQTFLAGLVATILKPGLQALAAELQRRSAPAPAPSQPAAREPEELGPSSPGVLAAAG